MRRMKLIGLLLALCCTGSAWADCSLPPAPSRVPDGNNATEAEMMSAMQTLQRYDTDVKNYTKCLQFEANQKRISRDERARRNNAAIDGLQVIAARFNEQVRLYRARSLLAEQSR
jgi:hypothetical protein